jgi:hypothetical protein
MSSIHLPRLTQIPGLFNQIKTPESVADLDMPGSRFTSLHRNSAKSCEFEIILKLVGWRKAKWDPIWNIVHWVILSGHAKGLGAAFQEGLS